MTTKQTLIDESKAVKVLVEKLKGEALTKDYVLRHPKERAEYRRNRYLNNEEYYKKQTQHWRTVNRDRARKQFQEYARTHSEELRAYRQAHREQIYQSILKYQQRYPERFRQIHLTASRNHTARKNKAEGSFTEIEFQAKCKEYDNRCAYCGTLKPLEADHMVPLVRGGTNTINNIIPACKSYNCAKGTLTYEEYITRLHKEANPNE